MSSSRKSPERGRRGELDQLGLPAHDALADRLRLLHDRATRFERLVGDSLGANPTDMSALQHLVVEGVLTPGELAERLRITNAAATLVVDRLAASGHVERRPHPEDRRKVAVVPDPRSVERAITALLPVVEGVVRAAAELDERERAVVERFLDRVLEVYDDAAEIGVKAR